MKPATTRILLWGCFSLWAIAIFVGSMSSESTWGIQQSGAILCPKDSTPGHTTYQQTVTDSDGHTSQDTAWILQCKDAGGAVVKEDRNYMWPWMGIFLGAAMLLTLPVLVAVLIGLLVKRARNSDPLVHASRA